MGKILNIINFIRGIEPRPGRKIDLLEPVIEQMNLAKQYDFPVTWLMQYDALIDPKFTAYLKAEIDDKHEIGAWFEVVEPMAKAAEVPWSGRYPWDWHADKGFTIGYTPAQRERLSDAFMAKFRETWGFYPDSVGSWFIDAHTLDYLYRKYHISASCNCKEQWGTDGYSLWGGYWGNAYYPSRLNSYIPAQTAVQQIPVPIFRMLGSDAIYQYNGEVDGNGQCAITLEPVYTGDGKIKYGGGDPIWTRWFLNTTFSSPDLNMSYAQAGQENSFGWSMMKDGLIDQFALFAKMAEENKIVIETLRDSARSFRCNYELTPATAIVALEDWQKQDRASIWYLSRSQRINFFVDKKQLLIRDWYYFDERYREAYLQEPCTTSNCYYDSLPMMDGFLWKDGAQGARIYFRKMNATGEFDLLSGEITQVDEINPTTLAFSWKCKEGIIRITADEAKLYIDFGNVPAALEYRFQQDITTKTKMRITPGKIHFEHNTFQYDLCCECGTIHASDKGALLIPVNRGLIFSVGASNDHFSEQ